MARGKRIKYLSPDELYETWKQWRDSAENVQDRVPPEQLGVQILALCTHLTNHRNFRDYPQVIKEELISSGCEKILKNLKNVKEDMAHKHLFAYYTSAAWCAFVNVLKEHYKNINIRRKLLLYEMERMKSISTNSVYDNNIKGLQKLISLYNGPTIGNEDNNGEN